MKDNSLWVCGATASSNCNDPCYNRGAPTIVVFSGVPHFRSSRHALLNLNTDSEKKKQKKLLPDEKSHGVG